MNWYLKAIRQYADFSGRARRMEYWMFVLFNLIFAGAALLIDFLLGSVGVLYILYVLFALIPGLAVMVRRLHDVGKSGWMFFVAFIPLIGGIWLLVLLFSDSEPGSNNWGDNPKSDGTEGLLQPYA